MAKTARHPGSGLRQFYMDAPLEAGTTIAVPHALNRRLGKVLRLGEGAEISLFNGKDGLFAATLGPEGKTASLTRQLKHIEPTAATTLLIGLPKRDTMDRVLRQATEMGVTTIQPLLTDYCVPDRLNTERAQTVLVEAAEQCERLTVPLLAEPCALQQAVTNHTNAVYWAYERDEPHPWPGTAAEDAALLIGPEGGFSPKEAAWLAAQPHVHSVSLGSTILRVDTAVVAALALLRGV